MTQIRYLPHAPGLASSLTTSSGRPVASFPGPQPLTQELIRNKASSANELQINFILSFSQGPSVSLDQSPHHLSSLSPSPTQPPPSLYHANNSLPSIASQDTALSQQETNAPQTVKSQNPYLFFATLKHNWHNKDNDNNLKEVTLLPDIPGN
jgi:hypothetical protein